jgi:hypothetical protein
MSMVANEGVALFAMPNGSWETAKLIEHRPLTTWLMTPGAAKCTRVDEQSPMHAQLERARQRRLRRYRTKDTDRNGAWSTESIY